MIPEIPEGEWRFFTVLRLDREDRYRSQLYGMDDDNPEDGYEDAWRASFEPAIDFLQSRGGGVAVVGWDGS